MSTLEITEITSEDQKQTVIAQIKELSFKLNNHKEVLRKLNEELKDTELEMQEKVNEYKTKIATLKDNIKNHTQTDASEKRRISSEISNLKSAIAEYEVNKYAGEPI